MRTVSLITQVCTITWYQSANNFFSPGRLGEVTELGPGPHLQKCWLPYYTSIVAGLLWRWKVFGMRLQMDLDTHFVGRPSVCVRRPSKEDNIQAFCKTALFGGLSFPTVCVRRPSKLNNMSGLSSTFAAATEMRGATCWNFGAAIDHSPAPVPPSFYHKFETFGPSELHYVK